MAEPVPVDEGLLRGWPLPEPGSDKEGRGTVLLVGGSAGVPGAMMLAGEAALRVGAGKLQVATTSSVARQLAVALPEALVRRTDEAPSGDIAVSAAGDVLELAEKASTVLVGPGMMSPDDAAALLAEVLPGLGGRRVVVDALGSAALTADLTCLQHLETTPVLTMNPGEVAIVLGVDEGDVRDEPLAAAARLASSAQAVVLCGGTAKVVATPDGDAWRAEVGNPGLGISGSGDVQAGIVAGLLARGADPAQAAVWGGWLHG
ncbi:MAG: NAD(P)H-hydrate dehydratase, partial [Nocardioidaceae bacterium]|nr:NAD(P)H-hydrate dehydratase [Nocardioidaceae bacterium]